MERLEIVHVDPVGKGRRDNNPRKPQQRGGPRKPGLPTVQFINTIHPSESASPRSLTLIRSHVAKHARALQRERRQQAQLVPPPRTPPLRVEIRSRPLQRHDSETRQQTQESDSNEEEPINQNDQMNEVRPGKRHGTQARWRQLPASETTMLLDPDDEELLLIRNRAPSPIQLIGGARGDAHHGFARPLSNDEQYLFDFYFDYVIMYGYQACHHKEDATAFAAAMRTVWVPFAMTEPSLMAAIFHVACRNYASITDNTNTTKFTLQKLQYRQMCLNMAMEAIASEEIATDATISLALLMASESYFEGDVEAFCAHGRGIIKMVAGRGGLKSLGLYGFLRKLVGWSIYNPKNYIVLGPEEQD